MNMLLNNKLQTMRLEQLTTEQANGILSHPFHESSSECMLLMKSERKYNTVCVSTTVIIIYSYFCQFNL